MSSGEFLAVFDPTLAIFGRQDAIAFEASELDGEGGGFWRDAFSPIVLDAAALSIAGDIALPGPAGMESLEAGGFDGALIGPDGAEFAACEVQVGVGAGRESAIGEDGIAALIEAHAEAMLVGEGAGEGEIV